MADKGGRDARSNVVAQPKGLRQGLVKRSMETFDWPMLEAHLNAIDFDAAAAAELVGLLRRDANLIMKRPDAEREAKRRAYVDGLMVFITANVGTDAANRLAGVSATASLIEAGYGEILRTLANVEAAKLPPEVQASAALRRAAMHYHGLVRDLERRTRRRKQVTLQGLRVTRDDGSTYSPDGVLAGIGQVTAMVLHLLGRRHGWFDREGRLTLPEPTGTTEGDLDKAGLTEALAVSWRHWERMDLRCRFFGGDLVAHRGGDVPDWAPVGTEALVAYEPVSVPEILDYIANQRLNDRMVQTYQEMRHETNMEAKAVGLARSPDLPPGSFVSPQEAHAGVALSETLGYSIVDDRETPCGLRLLEWVRGYAVLQALTRSRYETLGVDGLCTAVRRAELVGILERSGLGDGKAERFIELATLRASSRDIFDQPLLGMRDGGLLLFGPGVLDADLSRQTLSAIAAKGEALGRKGKAFEDSMLEFFRDRGFAATAAKFRQDGEEFEYDLLVPWDGFLFLFECKNRTLSGQDPVSAHHFANEMESAKTQVRRLVDGLSRHAAVVSERTGIDVRDKTIIPCVLNSLPYSIEGRDDGIHVVDASALTRFFQDRHFHLVRPHRLHGSQAALHRIPVASLWAADEPTATDLVAYLRDLPQLRLAMAHTEPVRHAFGLGERTVAMVTDLANKEFSVDSVSRLFSVDPRWVIREGDEVTRTIQRIRRRQERRAVIDADRAWRRRR